MSRASVIVSNEPPDPGMDPRVKDILMEVDTEDQNTSEHRKNYEISEKYDYFDGDLNIVDDIDDDNDTDKNEGDNSDIVDDVIEAINAPKKSRMTKHEKILERQAIKETKASIVEAAVESMKNGEFPSVRACARHYDIAHSTILKYMNTEEEYAGQGRRNTVIIVVLSTGSYTGEPVSLFASTAASTMKVLVSLIACF